nr:MAG TPA: hypothetical protein [Caudoviricetes sp.]
MAQQKWRISRKEINRKIYGFATVREFLFGELPF